MPLIGRISRIWFLALVIMRGLRPGPVQFAGAAVEIKSAKNPGYYIHFHAAAHSVSVRRLIDPASIYCAKKWPQCRGIDGQNATEYELGSVGERDGHWTLFIFHCLSKSNKVTNQLILSLVQPKRLVIYKK